jgi:hypothetical protein
LPVPLKLKQRFYISLREGFSVAYGLEVESPYLVHSGHRDQQRVSVNGNYVPWGTECLDLGVLVALTVETLFTRANDGQHLLLSKVDLADCVVFSVAEVDEVLPVSLEVAHALGVVEAGFLEAAVDEADPRTAYRGEVLPCLLVDKHKAIVARV